MSYELPGGMSISPEMMMSLMANMQRVLESGVPLEKYLGKREHVAGKYLEVLASTSPDTVEGVRGIINVTLEMRETMVMSDRMEAVRCFYASRNMGKVLLDKCKVLPSPVHGNGVFATRDIAVNEVITLYPCDIVTEVVSKGIKYHIPLGHPFFKSKTDCERYSYFDRGLMTLALVGDPLQTDNPTFLGHMCNDKSKCGSELDTRSYLLNSHSSNASFTLFDKEFVAIVAKRSISNGEEIFVTYGVDYWLRNK